MLIPRVGPRSGFSAVSAADKENAIERDTSEWNLHGVPNAQIALDVD